MLNTSAGNPRYNKKGTVNKNRLAKYTHDMITGDWQLTPAPIAFNERGELVDGHHRLHAIITSGKSVLMCVAYDVPNETTVFDRGLNRSTTQFLRFSEKMDSSLCSGSVIAAIRLHFAFANITNARTKRESAEIATDSEIARFIKENESTLSFCAKVVKSSGHGLKKSLMENGPCIYAFWCALMCGVPEQYIRDFAKIIRSGLYDRRDQSAAIIARNYLLVSKASDIEAAAERTSYVQTALVDFVNGIPRERKYSKTSPVYTNKLLKLKT